MVAIMDREERNPFKLIIMQHTHCGAERFANPNFQKVLRNKQVLMYHHWPLSL